MGKPSIFSREYEKKMRRRKRRIVVTVIISTLMAGLTAMMLLVNVNWTNMNYKNMNISEKVNAFLGLKKQQANKENDKVQTTKAQVVDEKKDSGVAKVEKVPSVEQKEYTVKMASGQDIKTIYETKGQDKTFKYISPADSGIIYDISASGKEIVIFDEKAQSIRWVDTEGNQADISAPTYTGTDGTVYSKENQLNVQPDYVWCSSPKFIDEENVAYISQLPWFNNQGARYVWIVNIKTKAHIYVSSISGADIKLETGKEKDKGIKVIVDGKELYLKGNGEVTQ